MRNLYTFFLAITVVLAFTLSVLGQAPKAPSKPIVFEAKTGKVTYDHKKHADRVKGDCKTCHPAPFAQSRAPINFKPGPMHAPATKAKASCAKCHVEGGGAFVVKGNCAKCHVKGGA
ncbi:MAG: cytochrome C [Acidobacteria bacterium]|nr:cytochrome C [Acidobacteriota bacterium]